MAITERYVTDAAGGGGVGTSGDPWTLAEALTSAVAGDRVNVQSDGPYSLGADTISNAGTAAALVIFRGYNSTIGDLEGQGRNADGTLDTTNFPAITLTGTLTPSTRSILQNLNIFGSVAAPLVGGSSSDYWGIVSCKILNMANSSAAYGCRGDNELYAINSDVECSGTAYAFVLNGDTLCSVIGCRVKGTADSPLIGIQNGFVGESVVIGNNNGVGIAFEATALPCVVKSCTFYNLDEAVRFPSEAFIVAPILMDNHVTDCATWLDSQYSATADNAVIEINNRTRDNVTPRNGIGDGLNVGEITTDTGGIATDFVDAANGNLRLISGAPGESAGLIAYSDVGAYQREPSAGGSGGSVRHHRAVLMGDQSSKNS